MTRTPGKLRKYPYFKVQARDPVSMVWKDHQKEAFDDLDSARTYRCSIPTDTETRIVMWERAGSRPLPE